jgi:hypothetical protein
MAVGERRALAIWVSEKPEGSVAESAVGEVRSTTHASNRIPAKHLNVDATQIPFQRAINSIAVNKRCAPPRRARTSPC